jgi:hypothetical protein
MIYTCTCTGERSDFLPQMELFIEACKRLDLEGTPVLWIFDSLPTLAIGSNDPKAMACRGDLYELFRLSHFLIPLPITTAGSSLLILEGM